jgi:hypothetical protein
MLLHFCDKPPGLEVGQYLLKNSPVLCLKFEAIKKEASIV